MNQNAKFVLVLLLGLLHQLRYLCTLGAAVLWYNYTLHSNDNNITNTPMHRLQLLVLNLLRYIITRTLPLLATSEQRRESPYDSLQDPNLQFYRKPYLYGKMQKCRQKLP
jgi:hypothetical protein